MYVYLYGVLGTGYHISCIYIYIYVYILLRSSLSHLNHRQFERKTPEKTHVEGVQVEIL